MVLWLATVAAADCLDEAKALLREAHPPGVAVLEQVSPQLLRTYLDCDADDLDVPLALHEGVHALGGIEPDDHHAIVLLDGTRVVVRELGKLPVSVVGKALAPSERDSYHDTYLTGRTGEQGLVLILDELGAYAWTLRAHADLHRRRPYDGLIGARDGVAVMLVYLAAYLDELRKQAPEQHAAVVADEAHRAVAKGLVGQVVGQLAATCGTPALGIDDGYWLRRAWGLREELAPLVALPKLPKTCAPLVAAAPAKLQKRGQVVKRASLEQTVETTTVTITVNGETVTLDELRARAADDPELAKLLLEIEAQLSEE